MHSLDHTPRPSEPRDPMNMTNTMVPYESAGRVRAVLSPWRSWLLSTVTAGMMFLGYGRYGRAQVGPPIEPPAVPCNNITNGGTTVNCSGDITPGVEIDNPTNGTNFTTLKINSLTADITPENNQDGIRFQSEGDITINSDTGQYGMTITNTTDFSTYGIKASSNPGSGDGGKVVVTQTGDMTLTGKYSYGIKGSSSSEYGDGGPVTVKVKGAMTLTGNYSYGVYAFSYASSINSRNSGKVMVTMDGDITTMGNQNYVGTENMGIAAISKASHGTAGPVEVMMEGNIMGLDNPFDGIYALSLSSGGDAGGVTVTQTGDITIESGMEDHSGTHGIEAISTALGGDAGAVTVEQHGTIKTYGPTAYGVRAYSHSTTGDAGTVTVIKTGDITTTGESAYGVGAKSRSTGGNARNVQITVSENAKITTTGDYAQGVSAVSTSNYGHAGTVTITVTGDITTMGEYAEGIFARSESITAYGSPAGNAGAVTVTHTGNIRAEGDQNVGIEVSSSSNYGNAGPITVRLNGGTIYGERTGVSIADGTTNRLIINNAVTISGGDNDIVGGSGDETILNYGTLTSMGDIDLGTGSNAFMNHGRFNSGNTVDLGMGNLFTNHGTLSPGDTEAPQTTRLTGNFVQSSSGALAMNVDPAGVVEDDLIDMRFDPINLTGGGSATLEGGLAVYFSQPTGTAGESFLLLDTDHEIADRGIELSAAVNAKIEYLDNGNDLYLTLTNDDLINFAPTGLNRNQTGLGQHLNGVFDANPTELNPVLDSLLYATFGLEDYKNALDQLSPQTYLDTQIAALFSSNAFSDSLLSCHINGAGVELINKEGECWWMNATGRFLNRDATSDNIGYDETVGSFAVGRQLALGSVWHLSVGMGYQHSGLTTNTNATSNSNQLQGGVALKYNPGALLLAAAVNGGYGWYDTTRPMAFGTFNRTAQGKQDINLFAARLLGSHVFGSPRLFVKPILSGAATRLGLSDITEGGAGSANLRVSGQTETIYSVSPALETGTQWRQQIPWLGEQTLLRPYVRGGMTWLSRGDVSTVAAFVDSPSSVAPFPIVTTIDQTWTDVAAGLEMITAEHGNVRLYYSGHISNLITIHSAGVKLGVTF